MCVFEYRAVCFTHCLVYLMFSDSDSSASGSTHFSVFRVYNICSRFFIVNLLIEGCLECCVLLCVSVFCIVLYCILLYCVVLS
jgi:hypothetical protein